MVTNLIIGNLAVADLAVCLLKVPVSVATIVAGSWVLGELLCNIVGFINALLLFEVLYSLALVSISRYCCVVSPSKFSSLFTKQRTFFMIGGTWILSILCAVPPIFHWGSYHYEEGKAICVISMNESLSYTIVLAMVQFIIPFLLITVPYCKIFRFLQTHNRRLSANSITSSFRRQSRTSLFHDFKMTKLLLIIVIFFVACWTPYSVVNLLAGFNIINPIPLGLDAVCNLLTFLSSSCNPYIYGLLNNQFQKGFRDVFCGLCQKFTEEKVGTGIAKRSTISKRGKRRKLNSLSIRHKASIRKCDGGTQYETSL
ncbi:melatonin receptor type 1C-like isoform X2 [Actinia tenebrosa]|nr:melatonin receptor type 1C-like isoform X2 [Actinia tenebrosa]XP_031556289.1 melatonin receptor type 1C-like isoform X2 [Actinia tenebrosa]